MGIPESFSAVSESLGQSVKCKVSAQWDWTPCPYLELQCNLELSINLVCVILYFQLKDRIIRECHSCAPSYHQLRDALGSHSF